MSKGLRALTVLAGLFASPGCLNSVKQPPAHAEMVVDPLFQDYVKDCLDYAADKWREQSDGIVDLHFTKDGYTVGSDRVVFLSPDEPYTKRADVRIRDMAEGVPNGGVILGQVSPPGGFLDQNYPERRARLELVPERFKGQVGGEYNYCRLVAMHEIGHLYGVIHWGCAHDVKAPGCMTSGNGDDKKTNIMYPVVYPGRTACLKQDDLHGLCLTTGVCSGHTMHPCEDQKDSDLE